MPLNTNKPYNKLGSPLNDVSLEQKFENQFRTWQSGMPL